MIDCSPYIELLRQMVSIPSLSKEEGGVTALLSSALDSMGIDHKIYKNNIIALNKSYSADKKTLALDAHIDTVPPAIRLTQAMTARLSTVSAPMTTAVAWWL